ncbi:unnamed protein product [Schistocephalus solidus]|uniref:Uncharacterized protein n=1 Tax=Schistocephalus solidus TaxID=70667 RepID=A0A183SHZ0_SCHSO|nr:unnamed protein product [Schistocephalus solidus]
MKAVNAPVAASSWYQTLTCGFLKLVLPSGHTPGNGHDWRAKPDEGLRCCVGRHTRYVCSIPPAPPTLQSSLSSPLLFPAHSLSPLLLLILPFLSPFFLLSLLLPFTLTSSLLPFSSHFNHTTWSKTSYGESDMQSRRRPWRIGRSLTNPNPDPYWSLVAAWDDSAALFRAITAYPSRGGS